MNKRLFPIWREFEERSLLNVPPDQRVEMQKAFFMGAAALLSILQEIPDDMAEEEGAEILEQVHQECVAYLETAAADFRRRKPKGFGRGGDR